MKRNPASKTSPFPTISSNSRPRPLGRPEAPISRVRYQPYYCEENIWWLCQDVNFKGCRVRVVFISNPSRTCPFAHQRAGGVGGEVVWDYHVVLWVAENPASEPGQRAPWWTWDPDSRLGMPVLASEYLALTFSGIGKRSPELAPFFRVIDKNPFLELFVTDRSHMRGADGRFLQPPPPWKPPGSKTGEPTNLMRFVDVKQEFVGEVLSLEAMRERYGAGTPAT